MHMTLHLTNDCNLQCSYCCVCQKPEYMNRSTAEHAVRLAAASGEPSCGIIFFGGELLLCRDTIRDTVAYCRARELERPVRFHFKMTTNGTLLDREFLEFSRKENIFIALSLTASSIPVPSLWDTESSRLGMSWAESMRKSVRSCLNAMNWKKRSVRAVPSSAAATVTAAA